MHNNKVLKNVLFIKDFKIVKEKYYFANTRYHNMDYLLCIYCGIYYNLKKIKNNKKKTNE